MLVIVLIYLICFGIGKSITTEKTKYFVAIDYKRKAVVYQDSDKYVLMPYDENKNELQLIYQIIPADEIGTIELKETGVIKVPRRFTKG